MSRSSKKFKSREIKRSPKPTEREGPQAEQKKKHSSKGIRYNSKNGINRYLDCSSVNDSVETVSKWKGKSDPARKARIGRMLSTWKEDIRAKSISMQNRFKRVTQKDDKKEFKRRKTSSGDEISKAKKKMTGKISLDDETGFRRRKTSHNAKTSKVKFGLIDFSPCSSEIEECMRLLGKDCQPTKEVQLEEIRRRNQIYGVKEYFTDNVTIRDAPQHSFFNQRKMLPEISKLRSWDVPLEIPVAKGKDTVKEPKSNVADSQARMPVAKGSLSFLKHMDEESDFFRDSPWLGK